MSPLINELVQALRVLPGVGPRSAQRAALYLLQRQRAGGLRLAQVLEKAMREVAYCECCRDFSEHPRCFLCQDAERQQEQLCVVETPMDVQAIEASGIYRGRYFVLHGHLSPLDGVGPSELALPLLLARVREEKIEELILAMHATLEGETTCLYLRDALAGLPVRLTRIAQGVPMGSDLDTLDSHTLAHALQGRQHWSTPQE